MRYERLVGLAAAAIVAACGQHDATGPNPAAARWTVTPTRLALPIGGVETLTVTILTETGEPLDADRVDGWAVELGGGPFYIVGIQGLDGTQQNPQRYRIDSYAPGLDTMVFSIGSYQGCPDPPECTGAEWVDLLPPLHVPVEVR